MWLCYSTFQCNPSYIIGKLNLEFRTLVPTVSNHALFGSRKVKHCICKLQFEISGTQLWILANFRPTKDGALLKAAHSACVHITTFWGSNLDEVTKRHKAQSWKRKGAEIKRKEDWNTWGWLGWSLRDWMGKERQKSEGLFDIEYQLKGFDNLFHSMWRHGAN